jgi:bifunctional non-homologous end joining protein LigD
LRHPSFQGLRPDKKAAEVVRERPVDNACREESRRRRRQPSASRRARATSVSRSPVSAISHPDKPYFPEANITKGDVAQYYADVAPYLLPHIANRPLSLVRCPDGWQGQCFYQKNADKAVNPAVSAFPCPRAAAARPPTWEQARRRRSRPSCNGA